MSEAGQLVSVYDSFVAFEDASLIASAELWLVTLLDPLDGE